MCLLLMPVDASATLYNTASPPSCLMRMLLLLLVRPLAQLPGI